MDANRRSEQGVGEVCLPVPEEKHEVREEASRSCFQPGRRGLLPLKYDHKPASHTYLIDGTGTQLI